MSIQFARCGKVAGPWVGEISWREISGIFQMSKMLSSLPSMSSATDLLPVEYYNLVFTLPAPIAAIAWYNKAVVYGLLFDIAAEPCAPSPPTRNTWARRSA